MQERVETHVGSLVEAIKQLLGRWANDDGVTVYYNRRPEKKHLLRFSLITPDRIGVSVTYDLTQTSRQYIDNMVDGVRNHVLATRQKRHESPIIINTSTH